MDDSPDFNFYSGRVVGKYRGWYIRFNGKSFWAENIEEQIKTCDVVSTFQDMVEAIDKILQLDKLEAPDA
jgi:hypothetical protein